jgi:hypothetical protein
MWEEWIRDFEALSTHPNPKIREAAAIGIEYSRKQMNRASDEEHEENVYGRH